MKLAIQLSRLPPSSDPPDILGLGHRPTFFPHSNAGRLGRLNSPTHPSVRCRKKFVLRNVVRYAGSIFLRSTGYQHLADVLARGEVAA